MTRSQAVQVLGALRFGLVPYGALESLTVGYERLGKWVRTTLMD